MVKAIHNRLVKGASPYYPAALLIRPHPKSPLQGGCVLIAVYTVPAWSLPAAHVQWQRVDCKTP
jgi:hypothetical protein